MTTLLGISEKSRHLPGLYQTAPSVQMKPSAIFSSWASLGTSASKRGSRRSIVPMIDLCCCASAGDAAGIVVDRVASADHRTTRKRRLRSIRTSSQGWSWRPNGSAFHQFADKRLGAVERAQGMKNRFAAYGDMPGL